MTSSDIFNKSYVHLWEDALSRLDVTERHKFQYVSPDMKKYIMEEFPESYMEFGAGKTVHYKDFKPTKDNISLKVFAKERYFVKLQICYFGEQLKLVTPWMRAPFGASAICDMSVPLSLSLSFRDDDQDFLESLDKLQDILLEKIPCVIQLQESVNRRRYLDEAFTPLVKYPTDPDGELLAFPPYVMGKMSKYNEKDPKPYTVIFNHLGLPLTTPETTIDEVCEIIPKGTICRGILDLSTMYQPNKRTFSVAKRWSHIQIRPDRSYDGSDDGISKARVGIDFHRIQTIHHNY